MVIIGLGSGLELVVEDFADGLDGLQEGGFHVVVHFDLFYEGFEHLVLLF